MSPQRKPLFQRLKAMLAGVCALFRPRRPTPAPQPRPAPTPEDIAAREQAKAEAEILRALETLEALFASWCAGTLPPESVKRRRPRARPRAHPKPTQSQIPPAPRAPAPRRARPASSRSALPCPRIFKKSA